jgi:hypothetical protein
MGSYRLKRALTAVLTAVALLPSSTQCHGMNVMDGANGHPERRGMSGGLVVVGSNPAAPTEFPTGAGAYPYLHPNENPPSASSPINGAQPARITPLKSFPRGPSEEPLTRIDHSPGGA